MHLLSLKLGGVAAAGALLLGASAVGTGARTPAASAQSSTGMSAADLRITLDRLLAEHVLITGVALEKQVDNAPDYQTVAMADQQNGQQIADLVGSLYGTDAENTFLTAWTAHLQAYADFTQGLLTGDAGMQQQAQATLQSSVQTESTLLANATGIDLATLTSALNTHVQQTVAFVTAYASGDYPTAYTGASQAVDHMFMLGDMLAGAISAQMPQTFPGAADDATANLRATIDDLLAQHTALSGVAEEKDFDQAPDFPAVADALDMNSQMIAGLAGNAFGQQDANSFLPLWRSHIQDYYDFTTALRNGDQSGMTSATSALTQFVADTTALLTAALPNLDPATVSQMLTDHVMGTLQVIQAYAAGDYATTYATATMGIDHMFMFGDMLAEAIAQQTGLTQSGHIGAQTPSGR